MSEKPSPILVQNDPWLKDQEDAIINRITRFQTEFTEITQKYHSLYQYANSHTDLGIHFDIDSKTWHIREWAPGAKTISIVGDFNNWETNANTLTKEDNNIWSTTLPQGALKHQDKFKLRIHGADDSIHDRIPATITRTIQDSNTHDYSAQIWAPKEEHQWINKFPHISDLGYNTIQLMAVQEHPYYGSFGYHVSNFFAPSSRFGSPEDLKYLIDKAHGLNLAVIMDIVHSHSIKNLAEGLNQFDGTDHQYFHSGSKGNHPQWDSKCFNYGKEEVTRFLLSNVRYWLEEFQPHLITTINTSVKV